MDFAIVLPTRERGLEVPVAAGSENPGQGSGGDPEYSGSDQHPTQQGYEEVDKGSEQNHAQGQQ